jgi:hypothetical protein
MKTEIEKENLASRAESGLGPWLAGPAHGHIRPKWPMLVRHARHVPAWSRRGSRRWPVRVGGEQGRSARLGVRGRISPRWCGTGGVVSLDGDGGISSTVACSGGHWWWWKAPAAPILMASAALQRRDADRRRGGWSPQCDFLPWTGRTDEGKRKGRHDGDRQFKKGAQWCETEGGPAWRPRGRGEEGEGGPARHPRGEGEEGWGGGPAQ